MTSALGPLVGEKQDIHLTNKKILDSRIGYFPRGWQNIGLGYISKNGTPQFLSMIFPVK